MPGSNGVIYTCLLIWLSFGLNPYTVIAQCDFPLGLEDGNITNDQLSASTTYSIYTAQEARLNVGKGWVGSSSRTNHLTLDLLSQHEVRSFAIQGSTIGSHWFSRTVQLFYSLDHLVWETYVSSDGRDVIEANSDHRSVNTYDLNPPIRARYITFNPLTWSGRPSLRLEMYGCELDQPIPVRHTDVSGDIQDSQEWIPSLSPYVVNALVTIRPSGSLKIQPRVKVVFNSSKAGLLVLGHLETNGLTGLPVVFSSSYPVNREANKWTGLEVLAQGNLTLNHCTITGAVAGIKGPLTSIQVKNCHIQHNNIGVDLPMGDTDPDRVQFLGTTISDNIDKGIRTRSTWSKVNKFISIKDSVFTGNEFYIQSDSVVRVENTIFSKSRNGIYGVTSGMSATVINCTFSDNARRGIYIYAYRYIITAGESISVTNSIFRDNGYNGIYVYINMRNEAFLKITDNNFVANPRKNSPLVLLYTHHTVNTSLIIENNFFSGREALLVDVRDVKICEVIQNTFTGLTGDRGLYFNRVHEVRLLQNSFTNCSSMSVVVTNVLQTIINENSFDNPKTMYDLLIETPYNETYRLSAQNNFWGSSDKRYVRGRVCDFYCDMEKLMADVHPFYTTESMTELSSNQDPDQFFRHGSIIGGRMTQSLTLGPNQYLFVNQTMFVPSGLQLTILQNTTLAFAYKQGIFVKGVLSVEGEEEGRAVLTNNRTDKIVWGGVFINSTESYVSHATMRNVKYGLNIQTNTSGSVMIRNTSISQCTIGVLGYHWANTSVSLRGVNISNANKALMLKNMDEHIVSLDLQNCNINSVIELNSDIKNEGFDVSLKNNFLSGSNLFQIGACHSKISLYVVDTIFVSTSGYSMDITGSKLDLMIRNVSSSGNYGHISITSCSSSYVGAGTIDIRDSYISSRHTEPLRIRGYYYNIATVHNVTIMNNEIRSEPINNAIYMYVRRSASPWTVSIIGNILRDRGLYLSVSCTQVEIRNNTIFALPNTAVGLETNLQLVENSSCSLVGNIIHTGVIKLLANNANYVFQVTENTFNSTTIEIDSPMTVFTQNNFLNGSGYDIKYVGNGHAGQEVNCSYNYWGTTSRKAIEKRLYDSYYDETLPTFIYVPFYGFPNMTDLQSPEENFLSPDDTIGGRVGGAVTLTRAGSPYTVTANIVVDKQDTLVIEAGVTLLFLRGFGVTIEGTFKVQGNRNHPVVATSLVSGEKWAGIKLKGHIYRQADTNGTSVRLVDGEDEREGRLEVKVGDFWGTVCDDSFDVNDAAVACTMLGYSSSNNDRVHGSAHFGEGSGPIHLDDLGCTGSENTLFQCSATTSNNCGHNEDVGIRCGGELKKQEEVQNEVELSYLTINDTENGLEFNGNVTLAHGIVSSYSQNHGIVITAGHPSMTSLTIDNFITSNNAKSGITFLAHSLTYSWFHLLHLKLSNCEISSNQYGIRSAYHVNISITGCTFRDNMNQALYLQESASYIIENSVFSQNERGVLYNEVSTAVPIQYSFEEHIYFFNNSFTNNSGIILNFNFPSLTAKTTLNFQNNTFQDNNATVCKLDPSLSSSLDYYFLDNTIISNTASVPNEPLIEIMYYSSANGSRIKVTGNTFINNTAFQAVLLSNNGKMEANTSISNNIFRDNKCSSTLSTVVFGFELKENIFENPFAECELEAPDFERWYTIDARRNFWGFAPLFKVHERICGFDKDMGRIFVRYMPYYLSEELSALSPDSHTDFWMNNLQGGIAESYIHLERSRSPYHIKRSILIRNGGYLEVEDGVEVRFSPNTGIYVDGVFKANGNLHRIILTNSSEALWYGVIFPFKTEKVSDTVRLVGGASPNEGRVELFVNGSWSTLCKLNDIDAELLCQALGYEQRDTSPSKTFEPGKGPIMESLGCGSENISLAECWPSSTDRRYCNHDDDKALFCKHFVSLMGTEKTSSMERVSVLNSKYGLKIQTETVKISQCHINNTEMAGLTVEGNGIRIDLNGTVVEHGQSDGIVLQTNTRVEIRNGTTQHNSGSGMSLTKPLYHVIIEDINFNNNSKKGLDVNSPTNNHFKQIHVRNNVIANHSQDFGLKLIADYNRWDVNVLVEKNDFLNNSGGSIYMPLSSYCWYRRQRNVVIRSNRFNSSGAIFIRVPNDVSMYFEDNIATNCKGGDRCFFDLTLASSCYDPNQNISIATNTIEKTHGKCVFSLISRDHISNATFNYNQILASSTQEAAIVLDSNQFTFFYNLFDNPKADYELKVVKASTDEVKADRNWWGMANANTAGARILHRSQDQRLMLVNYMPILTDQNFDCSGVNNCTGRGECVRPNGCRCISGWTGASCTEYDCSRVSNCNGNGRCVGPNQCECSSGWEGESCVLAACHDFSDCSGRQRGFCVLPNQCACFSQYTGSDCSRCASLRWGPSCLPCPRCQQGTCNTTDGQCECASDNWTGELCNRCSDTFYGPNCMPYINILNVIPSSGPDTGATTVHVWGHNFPETPRNMFYCRFDRTVVNGTRITKEHIVCESPQHQKGVINVEISADGTEFTQNQTKFTYYSVCPPGSCGKAEDPPHGYCLYGGCVCTLPWSGANCSVELKAPVISPESLIHTVREGNEFRLKFTLTQGSDPITWNLYGAPVGMEIISRNGEIYWERTVASETPYTIRMIASNIIGRSEVQMVLAVPLSYNVTIDEISPTGSLPSPRTVRITGHVNFFNVAASALIAFVDVKIRNKGKISSKITVETSANTQNRVEAVYFYKAGDSGLFEVDGRHPSDSGFTTQKSWSVLGMKCNPGFVSRQAYLDTDLVEMRAVAVLRNDGIGIIRDIGASVQGIAGPLISVVVRITNRRSDEQRPLVPALEPDSEVEFDLILNASRPLRGTIGLIFNTAEGTVARMRVGIQLNVRRPVLILSTNLITDSISKAAQKTFQVNITNEGEVRATALKVTLPDTESRLSVTSFSNSSAQGSENDLDLQPGDSAVLVLTVTTGSSDDLGEFSGSIALNSDLASASIRYRFYVTSLTKLNVTVRVEDEFTYFASDKPLVSGAVVTLRNPRRGYLEQRITTNSSEFVNFEDVTEDQYTLSATAPGHASYSRIIIAKPSDSSYSIFLQRVAVTYTWTVEPTTFEDKYVVTLESTFETQVPMPVVTVEPANINLIPYEEGKKDVINFNITNHGLIRADNVRLVLPTNQPMLVFTQTVDPIGDVPANTSIIVPVMVTLKSRVKRNSAESACGLNMLYDYFCGVIRTGGQHITLSRQYPGRPPRPCGRRYIGVAGTFSSASSRPSSSMVVYNPVTPISCDCVLSLIKDCVLGFHPIWGCATAIVGLGTSSGFLGVMKAGLDYGFACILGPLGPVCPWCGIASTLWTIVNCLYSAATNCGPKRRERAANSEVAQGLLNSNGPMRNYLIMMKEIFGGEEMFNVYDNSWMNPFNLALAEDSVEGQFLSESEITSITAPLNSTLVPTVRNFLLRWNKTVSAWEDGTLTILGADDGVMAYNTIMSRSEQFQADMDSAKQRGFDSIFDEFDNAVTVYKEKEKKGGKDEGVCAKVRVRIVQELVLTRNAFNARLEMENGELSALQNINVTVYIRPTYGDGTYTNDLFSIGEPSLVGITAVDGTGRLAQDMSGTSDWLIIPYSKAAVKDDTLYDVGGTLSYTVDGSEFSINLLPDTITVKPNPSLIVNYFHEKYVQGDDPMTADVNEPVIPFTLAVSVSNGAYGVARALKITSGQPEIIENEKGLLVSFKIIGAKLGSNPVTPSLAIDFGDIDSFETKTARWLLTSSLKGKFYNFTATFENINPLGDPQLSVLDHLGYHELVHLVRLETKEDELDDFLVNDVLDEDEMPDAVYDSSNGFYSSPVVEATVQRFYLQNVEIDGTLSYSFVILSALVNTEGTSTYFYIRLVNNITRDSTSESLLQVIRHDGKNILVDQNTWQTSYYHDNFYLHIFDIISVINGSSTVSYSLLFGPRNMFSPVFAQDSYEVELNTSQTPGVVTRVSATDRDQNSRLEFAVHNTSSFSVDELTGQIRSLVSLEIGSYEFSVSVTDSGRPSRSSTATVVVAITDGVPVTFTTDQTTQENMYTAISSNATSYTSELTRSTPSSGATSSTTTDTVYDKASSASTARTTVTTIYSSTDSSSRSQSTEATSTMASNTTDPINTTTASITETTSGPSRPTTVGASKSNRQFPVVALIAATCFVSLWIVVVAETF